MADVASLYTILSHQHGLEAVQYFLDQDTSLPQAQKDFIIELLVFATAHHYFWLGGCLYLQSHGVAMGAKFAPSLVNFFIAYWEKEVIVENPPGELRLGGTSMMSFSFGMMISPSLWHFLRDLIIMKGVFPYSMRLVFTRFIF